MASPQIDEWEGTVDFPYPIAKCVITRVAHGSSDPRCWAVLIIGAFYDDNDRLLWQTEIFFGEKPESEVTLEDYLIESDAEEGMSSNILMISVNIYANHFQNKPLPTLTTQKTTTTTLTATPEVKIQTSTTSASVPAF